MEQKEYSTPELVVLGDVQEITQAKLRVRTQDQIGNGLYVADISS